MAPGYLDRILERKRAEVADRKRQHSIKELSMMEGYGLSRRSLLKALKSHTPAVIAEIKGASPSKGVIREHVDPEAIATAYARAGASAISVLTDGPFFNGSLEYLLLARRGHNLPLLRKDFLIDSYQLYEARAYGADAVLLIMAALGPERLRELLVEAESLGLEVLVEIHDVGELGALAGIPLKVLGINNRNLSTFVTSLDVTCALAPDVPPGTVVVSESGIRDGQDVRRLAAHGVSAMLIGETFMRAPEPGDALRQFLAGCNQGNR